MKARWVRKLHTSPSNSLSVLKHINFTLNHVDLSTLLSVCGKEWRFRLGSSLHAAILKTTLFFSFQNRNNNERDLLVVWNSLVSMYARCGELSCARKLFDEIPVKDTVSWNSLVSGYLSAREFQMGFGFFKQMHSSELFAFDSATLTSILLACDGPTCIYAIKIVHAMVILNGFEREVSVGNALVTGCFRCECLGSAKRAFEEVCERSVVTWTAAIAGYAQSQLFKESLTLFLEMRRLVVDANSLTYSSSLMACSGLQALREGRQIHGLVLKSGTESDFCVESALMDMYSKCGNMEDAWENFRFSKEPDGIAMTVILVGLAQNGYEEVVELFVKLMKPGIEIDANMVSAILGVFGGITSLALGKQLHSLVEVQVRKIYCISKAVPNLPINIEDAARSEKEIEDAKKAGELLVNVGQDTRLNNRVLDIRTPANQAIFRIQSQVGNIFKQFLLSEDFVEVHTPKLIAGSSEGGSVVFKLDYKGLPACLAQSSQLHKQISICGDFGRVFEIGPVFRAEDSYTLRHLCEFTGLDVEMKIQEHYFEENYRKLRKHCLCKQQ